MDNLHIIREIAISKGMKLKWLSQVVGISEQGLQLIINTGRGKISTLQKIADVLEVDISKLMESQNMEENILNELPSTYKPTRNLNDITEIDYLQQVVRDKERIIQLLEKQLSNQIYISMR